MAEAAVDSHMDCLLCSEECVQPVTLDCEHRFCCRCLREHWAPSHSGDCPQCDRRSEHPPPKNDSGKLPGEKEEITSDKSVSQGGASDEEQSLQSEINKLTEKRERTEDTMKRYSSMLQHTEGQMLHCEAQIMQQFKWFHQFLDQEEVLSLSALRKEHQEKTQMIEEELEQLEEKLLSLYDSIGSEQQLQGQSSSLSEPRESLVLTDEPEPQLRPGLLIDQATVLGNLGLRVWEKMRTIVKYSPVILDPNTAHRDLRLSEDLTSVRLGDNPQHVPLNPERVMTSPSVLGSEGFSSGIHKWEVEVGDHPDWTIGVAEQLVRRKTHNSDSPVYRFWCLTFCNSTFSCPFSHGVKLTKRPETVRVELDFYAGKLSFYDAKDRTLICLHNYTFTEKVYPYFSVGKAGDGKDIKLCTHRPQVSAPQKPPPRAQTTAVWFKNQKQGQENKERSRSECFLYNSMF